MILLEDIDKRLFLLFGILFHILTLNHYVIIYWLNTLHYYNHKEEIMRNRLEIVN